jgi:hypothetical protein
MSADQPVPNSEIILYQTEDGRTRVECRFADENLWLTQALMAELFQKDVRTINEHLANIFEEGELGREATIRKFRIVRREGTRNVAREVEHYNLPAILAVGYRVRSQRGTQFRQWATARLSEYLVKGFVLDDERLKTPHAQVYRTTSMNCWNASATSAPANAGCTSACEKSWRWRRTTRRPVFPLRSRGVCRSARGG